MSNGTRHWLGLLLGVVATPLLFVGLAYVIKQLVRVQQNFGSGNEKYVASALMAGVAVLVAVLVSSRVSPVASLVPGVAFLALSAPHAVSLTYRGDDSFIKDLPHDLQPVMTTFNGPGGFLLFLAVLLLVASAFPARWRPRVVQPGRHSMAYTPASEQPQAYGPPALAFESPSPSPYGDPTPERPPSFGTPTTQPYDPYQPQEQPERPDWFSPPGNRP